MDFDHKKNLLIVNEFSKKIQTIDFATKAVGDLVAGLDRPVDVFSDSDNSVVFTEYNKGQLVRYNAIIQNCSNRMLPGELWNNE